MMMMMIYYFEPWILGINPYIPLHTSLFILPYVVEIDEICIPLYYNEDLINCCSVFILHYNAASNPQISPK